MSNSPRVDVWYSDGAASAVAAKMAVQKYGDRAHVIKCDTTDDEHPDNIRFRREVEEWLGVEIELIRSDKYDGIDDVFEARSYLAGIAGAPCTTELKKLPRRAYQRPDDIHVFGYTADEERRIRQFEVNNPELTLDWVLRERQITKHDCYVMLDHVGIALPTMYGLGFDHNNCLGCVKATSPYYWSKTRHHFPEAFQRRAEQSRKYGARLVRINGERLFLDEIPADWPINGPDGNIECGPFCDTDAVEVSLFAGQAMTDDDCDV